MKTIRVTMTRGNVSQTMEYTTRELAEKAAAEHRTTGYWRTVVVG